MMKSVRPLVKPLVQPTEKAEPSPLAKPLLQPHRQSKRGFRGLIFFGVLVFHGGVLLLPTPQWWRPSETPEAEAEPPAILEESGAIAITTLPVVPQPVPEDIAPAEPAPPPELSQPPQTVLTQVPETLPEQTVEDPEEPEENLPENKTDDRPDPEGPEESEPEAGIAIQFDADFPHLAGAVSGCYGLENCRRAEGQNYTDALREISEGLETQGYELTPYDGNDDSDVRNHRIFEMRLPSDPGAGVKYLNVFGDGLKAAIYIITPNIITQADLQALESDG
ncbi:MAG: hypothetical protein AAF243_10605 [Cyanobacteria bacterium P01_A01_bin.137]